MLNQINLMGRLTRDPELRRTGSAYEDTGLEPEELSREEIDALLKLTGQLLSVAPDRLRELAKADKEGRCVVLPCKVGDMVYFPLLGRIIEKSVFSIVSFPNSARIYCNGISEYFQSEDIGKSYFLTREEAEAALRRKQK